MRYKKMTTDELEALLPVEFQRKEMRDRRWGSIYPFEQVEQTVTYVRSLHRHDDNSNDGLSRSYFMTYASYNGDGLFSTQSYGTLHEALVEMCRILTKEGIISCEQGAS